MMTMSAAAQGQGFTVAGMRFVNVPGGRFQMGDPEFRDATPRETQVDAFRMSRTPVPNRVVNDYINRMGGKTHGILGIHQETGRPFVVGRSEEGGKNIEWTIPVTAAQIAFGQGGTILTGDVVRLVPEKGRYEEVLGERASRFIGPNLPATVIRFYEAIGLADILSHEAQVEITLPTEAQWEYAAKGGKGLAYSPNGKHPNEGEVHWNAEGPAAIDRNSALENPFGLVDMTGNVWERCLDFYRENGYLPEQVLNPTGPATGTYRVLRGGSWYYYDPVSLHSACRTIIHPHVRNGLVGLRLVAAAGGFA